MLLHVPILRPLRERYWTATKIHPFLYIPTTKPVQTLAAVSLKWVVGEIRHKTLKLVHLDEQKSSAVLMAWVQWNSEDIEYLLFFIEIWFSSQLVNSQCFFLIRVIKWNQKSIKTNVIKTTKSFCSKSKLIQIKIHVWSSEICGI